MSETPKCPYCGDKMILHILSHRYHANLTSAWYQCVTCDSASPRLEFPLSRATSATSNIEETTLAVTLRRVEPKKNHALTLEEVKAYCEGGADATPLWYDEKDRNVSRWMVIDLPELAFGSTATVKRLVNSQFFEATYGEKWRCWLRKPTKEEMENHPWEGATTND